MLDNRPCLYCCVFCVAAVSRRVKIYIHVINSLSHRCSWNYATIRRRCCHRKCQCNCWVDWQNIEWRRRLLSLTRQAGHQSLPDYVFRRRREVHRLLLTSSRSLSVDLFTGLSDIPDWIADIPVPLLLLLYTTSWYLAQDNALNVACGTDVIVTCRYCALSVSERLECLTFAQLLQKCHRPQLNSWR